MTEPEVESLLGDRLPPSSAYVRKKSWFGLCCLNFCAYFDCSGKIAWTKLVTLLWELTGLLFTCHEKQELFLGLCNWNKPAVFQIMLFFSFFFSSYFPFLEIPNVFKCLGVQSTIMYYRMYRPYIEGSYLSTGRVYMLIFIYISTCIEGVCIYTHIYVGCIYIQCTLYCLIALWTPKHFNIYIASVCVCVHLYIWRI